MKNLNVRCLCVLMGTCHLFLASTVVASQLPGAKGSEVKHEAQGPAMEEINLETEEYPAHRRGISPSKQHKGHTHQTRNPSEIQSE